MTSRLACVCGTLATVGLAVAFHTTLRLSAQEDDVTILEPDRAIERQLAIGERHRYAIPLTAGESASIVVEQLGIDVIAHLRGADGALIADVDDDIGKSGREQVT